MTNDEEKARWIVGFYDTENILNYAYIYPSKKEAMEEFCFDPERDTEIATVFLAKIVLRQERKKIEKYYIKTVDVEKGQTVGENEYSVTEES